MAFRYDTFDILAVAQLCGIEFQQTQRNDVEYSARCPFCGDRKYHLGLNRKKGVFHCFRCKEFGNSVSLYAKLYGISNGEAYNALKNMPELVDVREISYPKTSELPIRPIFERHNVYYDFLSLLTLNSAHRTQLMKRGLAFSDIHRFMYRSIPTDITVRREVMRKLSKKHSLSGIPGFYRADNGEDMMYCNKYGGVIIPVCNAEGYIQGLQFRLDVPPGSDEKKFRWFSSRYFNGGCGAKPWIHVVGDTSSDVACLTEGAMKADVSSVLSDGKLFLAVPGVNATAYLPDIIRSMGISKVYEAFDMDKRSKPQVRDALIRLRETLRHENIECVSCVWDARYKGLDDYFLAKTMSRATASVAA